MIVTIDTGGTKTLVTSFADNGHMGKPLKFPTPKEPKAYVAELKRVVRERYSDKKVDVIVIALPGIIKNGKTSAGQTFTLPACCKTCCQACRCSSKTMPT